MQATADVKCYYCGHISGQIVGEREHPNKADSCLDRDSAGNFPCLVNVFIANDAVDRCTSRMLRQSSSHSSGAGRAFASMRPARISAVPPERRPLERYRGPGDRSPFLMRNRMNTRSTR